MEVIGVWGIYLAIRMTLEQSFQGRVLAALRIRSVAQGRGSWEILQFQTSSHKLLLNNHADGEGMVVENPGDT